MKHLFITLSFLLLVAVISAQSYSNVLYLDVPNTTGAENFFVIEKALPVETDQMIIVANDLNGPYVYLARLDNNSIPIWGKRLTYNGLEEGDDLYIYEATITSNDELILVITINNTLNHTGRMTLAKMDANGNFLWASEWLNPNFNFDYLEQIGNDIYILGSDSDFNIATDYFFVLNENGNFQTGKAFNYPSWVSGSSFIFYRRAFRNNGRIEFWKVFLELGGTGPNPANRSAIFSSYSIGNQSLSSVYTTLGSGDYSFTGLPVFNEIFDSEDNRYIGLKYQDKNIIAKYDDSNNLLWSNDLETQGPIGIIDDTLYLLTSYVSNGRGATALLKLDKDNGEWLSGNHFMDVLASNMYSAPKLLPDEHLFWYGFPFNYDTLSTIGIDSWSHLVVRMDRKGQVENCIPFNACSQEITPAEAPTLTPIDAITQEDIIDLPQIAIDLVVEDIQFYSAPYCIPIELNADFTFDDPVCPEDSLFVIPNTERVLPTSSLWMAESALPSTSTLDTAFFQFQTSGIHEVQHILTMAGCKDTVTQTVEVLPQPFIELGDDTDLCEGDSLLLESGLSPNEIVLLWQDSSTNANYLVDGAGTYILQATNALGCTARDSIFINAVPKPEFSLGQDITICKGESTTLLPAPVPSSPQFDWNTGAMGDRLSVTNEGTYSLTITNQETGCFFTDSIRLMVQNKPLFTYSPKDTAYCVGVGLRLEAIPVGTSALDFEWLAGDTGPVFDVPSAGTYELVAFDGLCRDTLQISIPNGLCQADVYLPNAFSPNGDGRNDLFQPYGPDIEVVRLQVYNRWGSLVFEGSGLQAAWDGMIGGRKAETSTYVYVLEYKNILNLEQSNISGEVLLIR